MEPAKIANAKTKQNQCALIIFYFLALAPKRRTAIAHEHAAAPFHLGSNVSDAGAARA